MEESTAFFVSLPPFLLSFLILSFPPLDSRLLGMILSVLFLVGIELVYISSGFVGGTEVGAGLKPS